MTRPAALLLLLMPGLATLGASTSAAAQGTGAAENTGATASADTLRLEQVVEAALSGSPEIRRAEARADRIGAAELEGWGALIPSFGLSLGLNESQVLQRTATDPVTGGIVALPDSLIDLRESYGTSASIAASWTVFDGGRRYWNIRQARQASRAAQLRVEAARARLAADVTLAYLDVVETMQQVRVRRAEAERARNLTETAQVRFDVGEAPELDVLQARLAESDAELALLEAEEAAEAARLALSQYVETDLDGSVALLPPSPAATASLPAPEVLRACALRRSAALEALAAEVEAAENVVSAEQWAALLPRVQVGARWIRSEFGETSQAITLQPRNEQTYYQLQLSWAPLDQPARWLAQARRADAALAEAEAELAVQQPAITRDIEISLGRLRRARLLEERARLNTTLAEQQLEQATERYRLGVGSITETLQAESLAREAEGQRVTARFAGLRALAELQRTAGVRLADGVCGADVGGGG